ncbi:hypothetical protein BD779DRAFT_1667737 [Infundibulicybe gibba]|nr:hypothetical protein BD779DRAFT_1667737 [Infundibulicybe gibba]
MFSPFIETTIVSHSDTLMATLRPACHCQCWCHCHTDTEPFITWHHASTEINLNLLSPLAISSEVLPIPQEAIVVYGGGDSSNQTRGCPVSTQAASDPQFGDAHQPDITYNEASSVNHAIRAEGLIKHDIGGVPASLVPPLVMCETSEQEPEITHGRLQLRLRDHNPHVMPLEEIETEQWSIEDAECDNDTLRWFQQQRHNIVLDSVHPHITPHIVITPPEQLWDDHLVPWQNRLDPQYFCYLYVPPVDFGTSRIAINVQLPDRHPDFSLYDDLQPCIDATDSEITAEDPPDPPEEFAPAVGDPEAACVHSTATERLILREVVTALHRMRLKDVVYSAAMVANSFRQRYDALVDSPACYEKPLEWIDPAQYLLTPEILRNILWIFESSYPCTLPHIVLTPPQPLWLRPLSHHTCPRHQHNKRPRFRCGSPHELPGTPGPETPIDDFAHLNENVIDVVEIAAYDHQSYPVDLKLLPESRLSSPDTEDEDEDLDLPPFDSWYTNILSTGIPP